MTEEKKIHLPSEEINKHVTYADYEAFLVQIYKSVLPLKEAGLKNNKLSNIFTNIYLLLNMLCQNACGRGIKRAMEEPLIGSMKNPMYSTEPLNFYALTLRLNWFWTTFNFVQDDKDENAYRALTIAVYVGELAEELSLARDIKVQLPKYGWGVLLLGTILEPDLIFKKIGDIIERGDLKQNKNAREWLDEELREVFKKAEELYGFGKAFAIFFESGKLSGDFFDRFSLEQWKEIFKAAPEDTETARIAWEHIDLIIKDKRNKQNA